VSPFRARLGGKEESFPDETYSTTTFSWPRAFLIEPMSAKQLTGESTWDVQFAYEGKTTRHWKSVEVFEGTEREAEQRAQQLYIADQAAVDFMVVPADARP
jgi:hypothetical protein